MRFYYHFGEQQIVLEVSDDVYYPREDSVFMADFLVDFLSKQRMKPKRILDVGTGSGFLAILCFLLTGAEVTAVDVNRKAVECARKNAARNRCRLILIESDLFEGIRGNYDLVLFNPPYLPPSPESDKHLNNDKKALIGSGEISRFLLKLSGHLTSDGIALLLVSSLTPVDMEKLSQRNKLKAMVIQTKKLDWEELVLYKITTL
ncbi:MAG: hypothetical protein B6U68_00920 [Candidatus Aenigmarchaeota archaeon ex4484_14]|nr:MAG: hypothetical protein B6U68_00920 [Candidatus Aenigmarchaeota archaeon ex4484_14]